MSKGVPERDAVRLLRQLSVHGSRMIAAGDGRYRFAGQGRRPRAAEPDPRTVAALRARGLIAADRDGALVPTATGRTLVRRSLAGAEGYVAQHQERGTVVIDDPDLGSISVVVNHDESPLSWLRRRKGRDGRPLIDTAEFAAGERLRSDYARARILPRVTANWTATVADKRRDGSAGGMAELTEAALAARRRVEKALDSVGPELSGLLVDFCCFLKGLEEVERERRWPARSAKVVLRLGLSSLARHYGLLATASGRKRSSAIRHWGADDYRPTID
jgi:hypothetical protein